MATPLLVLVLFFGGEAVGFTFRQPLTTTTTTHHGNYVCTTTQLFAAAKKTKKKGTTTTTAPPAGIKGFGPTVAAKSRSSSSSYVETDRSKESRSFYERFLEKQGAGDNLKRTALGYTTAEPLPLLPRHSDTTLTTLPTQNAIAKLRGVVCTRDIPKGHDIIHVPYELALNLGPEGDDPTRPAVVFLRDYCAALWQGPHDDAGASRRRDQEHPHYHYYRMLPPYRGTDCLGSTDFFPDSVLEALQSPLVVEETLARRARVVARFQQEIASDDAPFPVWIDGVTPVTADHLQWAVWIITSRVLTVQGSEESGQSYRLLIPYLDMCNHDRTSPHVLTGRAVPGGKLRVVAGETVSVGDAVNICYGGGVAGNDRFLQDYGFLDADGYDIVAQELLCKRRIREGGGSGRTFSVADRERSLNALRATTMKQDEDALVSEIDPAMITAIQYRLGLKKALSQFMIMP